MQQGKAAEEKVSAEPLRPQSGSGAATSASKSQEPFLGVKVRRRSSLNKVFQGDYLELNGNATVLKLLSKHGDKAVLFADAVIKVDRKFRMQKRLILITDVALYILETESFRVKRRISLETLESLRLSELNDNFFAVIIPAEYDYLLASTRKTEVVTVLLEATRKLTGHNISVKFSNSFEYNIDSETVRQVVFKQVDANVSTKFSDKRIQQS